MRKDNLIKEITQNIYENSEQSITGQILQDTLLNMTEAVFDEMDEKIDNIEVSAYEGVLDKVAQVIPEFHDIIDADVPVDASQTIIDKSGDVIFCSPKRAFIYRLGLTYYKYWYSWRDYNQEISSGMVSVWQAIPNKLFKRTNTINSSLRQYVFNDTTKNLILLRSLEVTDELGDSNNIPMSQASITNLYNEGYKFAQLVDPGDTLHWDAEKKVFYITSVPGEYQLPSLSEDTIIYTAVNLVAGTILVNGEYGMELWSISPSYGLSVYGSPTFSATENFSIRVVIGELAEADLNTGRYSTQAFRSSEKINFDRLSSALILTGQISNQTGEIKLESWPPSISEPYIPLLISNGTYIIGGALFGAYTAWKLSTHKDNQWSIISSVGSAIKEVELNSCYTIDVTESANLTSFQLSVPLYFAGDCGFIKIAIVNRSASPAVLGPAILLGSSAAPYKYDQSIVNLSVPSNQIALFDIYIVSTLTGEKTGQALLDRKDWDI